MKKYNQINFYWNSWKNDEEKIWNHWSKSNSQKFKKYKYIYFDRSQISQRIAEEISYSARFPKKERISYEDLLNKLGAFEINKGKIMILEYINKKPSLWWRT